MLLSPFFFFFTPQKKKKNNEMTSIDSVIDLVAQ